MIPMKDWGRDHWGVFLYIEDVCVNRRGVPDLRRIQANENRHPGLMGITPAGTFLDGAKFGIRLAGGRELPGPDYDEWDCIDDLEREGLIEEVGTILHPLFKMTEKGNKIASKRRVDKANALHGKFAGNANRMLRGTGMR